MNYVKITSQDTAGKQEHFINLNMVESFTQYNDSALFINMKSTHQFQIYKKFVTSIEYKQQTLNFGELITLMCNDGSV